MLNWLNKDRKTRVAIIGDSILDEYLAGYVDRISPEAPVPVHRVRDSRITAGGAANTARNVQSAGGEALFFSICGQDAASEELESTLKESGVSVTGLVRDPGRPTIKKTRITANHQQILRVDWEKVHPISQELQDLLYSKIEATEIDGIIISDYAKGTLPVSFIARLIDLAKTRGIPSVVDPKGKDFARYKGADLIKPNRKEALEALGLDIDSNISGVELGAKLQETFGLANTMVTMGSQGMALNHAAASKPPRQPETVEAHALEVFDVSGAGDTVAALMGLAMASGMDLGDAMRVANHGAATVVSKWGTQPVLLSELQDAINPRSRARTTDSKIVNAELWRETRATMQDDLRTVFTNGCFDLLHVGHITYLGEARKHGDVLIVGINSDESVERLKGPTRPLVSLEERCQMLAALECVDYVIPFSEDTPLNLIKQVQPDVLIKGADYAEDAIVGAGFVKERGGKVMTVDLVEGRSTTNMIEKIRSELN